MNENTANVDAAQLELALDPMNLSVQNVAFKATAYVERLIKILELHQKEEILAVSDFIAYIWTYEAKDVAILLRDAELNLLKLKYYHIDRKRSNADVEAYHVELSVLVLNATRSLQDSYQKKLMGEGEADEQWIHETDPTEVVIDQLKVIIDQIKKIQRSERKLDKIVVAFKDYRTSYADYMQARVEHADGIRAKLVSTSDLIEGLEKLVGRAKLDQVVHHIDEMIEWLEAQAVLPSYENVVLEDIDRLVLPVAPQSGQLEYKTIDILSDISGWVSFNLNAPLRNMDKQLTSYKEKVVVTLFQMSNRIKARLDSDDMDVSVDKSDLMAPVATLEGLFTDIIQSKVLVGLDKIDRDVENLIVTSQFYDKNYSFLPTTNLAQVAEHTYRNNIQDRYEFDKIKERLTTFRTNTINEYGDGEGISVAAYVDRITSFNPTSDSNALFLRGGFLGSSFNVNRESLEKKIKSHFNLWTRGFGGGLILHGERKSGRSNLIEKIPLMFPEFVSHHLIKDQFIHVQGHKYQVTDDLIEAIKFILKRQQQSVSVITIDDFIKFAKSPIEIFDLFYELSELIRKNAKKIYVVVSLQNFLYTKLQLYFDLDNIFSEQLSTDNMSTDLIERAVMVRAQAVMNHDHVDRVESGLGSTARKAARQSHQNIGYAMQLWCMHNEQSQDFKPPKKFVKLVAIKSGIFRTLIEYGEISIPSLIHSLNEFDARELQNDLASLVEQRILIRPREGTVSISELLIWAVESSLKKTGL